MDKQKRALTGICLGHFFLDLYAALLIPLYPLIAQNLAINLATISAVVAIGHSISSFLQPLFGYISDGLNKRIFMFLGLIFASIFIPFGLNAPNVLVLTLCLSLGMIGNAFFHPQVSLMIKDEFEDGLKLSFAIGLFLGLGTIGYAFGPYVSGFVYEKFGANNYAYISLIGLMVCIVTYFLVPKISKREKTEKIDFLGVIKEISLNKTCIFLIIISIIKSALTMCYGTYLPFILNKFNFTLTQIGLIITIFYIMGGISMIFSSKLQKIVDVKGVILFSYLPILPLTYLGIKMLNYSRIIGAMLLILVGFFILLSAGVVLARAQNAISKHTGTISGIIQGFSLAIGSLMLIPLGVFGQVFDVNAILYLISSIAFVAAIFTIKTKLI